MAANSARAAVAHGGFPLLHALLPADQGPRTSTGSPRGDCPTSSPVDRRCAGRDPTPRRALYWKPWVDAAQHLHDAAGVHHGTPSMLLNGSEVDLGTRPELLESPSALRSYVQNAANRGE
ncbi:hypothetical protein [Streptacidiphilus rugosus]|uniref:hypothetical protein n=1 Tax=Streptacidiphilus rugosus TaxID=405783 RepID=UPI0012F90D42|nr:hypothetical protein [Streptacidiphilus rugosus]